MLNKNHSYSAQPINLIYLTQVQQFRPFSHLPVFKALRPTYSVLLIHKFKLIGSKNTHSIGFELYFQHTTLGVIFSSYFTEVPQFRPFSYLPVFKALCITILQYSFLNYSLGGRKIYTKLVLKYIFNVLTKVLFLHHI